MSDLENVLGTKLSVHQYLILLFFKYRTYYEAKVFYLHFLHHNIYDEPQGSAVKPIIGNQ